MALRSASHSPCLHLPFLYPPQSFRAFEQVTRRAFSQCPSRQYPAMRKSVSRLPKNLLPSSTAAQEPSMKVQIQKMMRETGLPKDMGLMEGTFVPPTGSNRPSIFSAPRQRMRLDWFRLKEGLRSLGTLLFYKYSIMKKPHRRQVRLLGVSKVAQALQIQMYTAFADGDVATLQSICATSLFDSFRSRLEARPPGTRLRWKLHRYRGWPRVVADRVAVVDMNNGAATRQAIVRIKSEQSLEELKDDSPGQDRNDARRDGENEATEEVQKSVQTEYIVLHKQTWKFKEGPWFVWGTIGESDWQSRLES